MTTLSLGKPADLQPSTVLCVRCCLSDGAAGEKAIPSALRVGFALMVWKMRPSAHSQGGWVGLEGSSGQKSKPQKLRSQRQSQGRRRAGELRKSSWQQGLVAASERKNEAFSQKLTARANLWPQRNLCPQTRDKSSHPYTSSPTDRVFPQGFNGKSFENGKPSPTLLLSLGWRLWKLCSD